MDKNDLFIKEHTEFTLGSKTKWELVNYIVKLEKNINKAIRKLDKLSGTEIGKAIQILRGENVRTNNKNSR